MFGWIDVGRDGGVIGASSDVSIVLVWDVILGGFAGFSKVGIRGKFSGTGRKFCTNWLAVILNV